MSKSFAEQWKSAAAWYAARPKREKIIIPVAALAVVWALSDALWLTPALRTLKTQQAAQLQKAAEIAQLESQRTAIQEARRVKEAEQTREEAAARSQLASIGGQLAAFEQALVPAQRMTDFLRSLLPAAGVEIVALRTLPPTPLIVRPVAKEGEAKAPSPAPAPAGKPAANIYRHGVEITLAGNYDALLAYLSRLEQSPQKVLWGQMALKVEKHPLNELTLVLYTLSLDPSWLVV